MTNDRPGCAKDTRNTTYTRRRAAVEFYTGVPLFFSDGGWTLYLAEEAQRYTAGCVDILRLFNADGGVEVCCRQLETTQETPKPEGAYGVKRARSPS